MKIPFSRTAKAVWNSLTYRSNGWNFSPARCSMYLNEYVAWQKYYLPVSVKGLTVLDVGAGEGETARFFLEHGAKQVICVESDERCFPNLRRNIVGRNMVCLCRKFQLSDLNLPFGFVKMDIEGYEEALLDVELTKPCVVEVHGLQLRERFEKKGYKICDVDEQVNVSNCYAYFFPRMIKQ